MGEVLATGAKVIKIIKPYADKDNIFSRISFAEVHGAVGVGMDVEHAVNTDNDADSIVMNEQMKLLTLQELKKYIKSTKLPFFIKGALSVQDAFKALALGADLVCVGRTLIPAYEENGAEGVAQVINKMNDELKAMMVRTGSPDPKHIDPDVIHYAPWLK